MIKKIICLVVIFVIFFALFWGCDRETETDLILPTYKTEEITNIEAYAQERQDNYSPENWLIVCGIVADGREAIATASDKDAVDLAVNETKIAIDNVIPKEEENIEEIGADDFSLSVVVDKANIQIGGKITVTVKLENLTNKDILCEVPDWIAAYGGNQLKDIIVINCLPCDLDFQWIAISIAVMPRPRVTLPKGAIVEKNFEYTASELNDVEINVGTFFYIQDKNSGRFDKQISLVNDPIKIFVEG